MNSSSKSIVNLALATSLVLVSVTGWSAEETKAAKKKSAKNAVASLHAGTSSSDVGMKPSAFRRPMDQAGAGTNGFGLPDAVGTQDIIIQTGGGTGNVVGGTGGTGSQNPGGQTGGGTGNVVGGNEGTGSQNPGEQTSGGTGGVVVDPTPEGSPG